MYVQINFLKLKNRNVYAYLTKKLYVCSTYVFDRYLEQLFSQKYI